MAVSTESGPVTVALICVAGLLVCGLAFVAVTADAATEQPQPVTDNTVTRIEVSESGSARWTVRIRTRLDTDERVRQYEAFQSRFRNDTGAYLGPFRRRNRGVVASAANATGREMSATNFTAATGVQEVPRRWGVVTYEFTWTNFAARENGTLVVGDVFRGGFFITANDTLQVVAPPAHEVARVAPDPDARDGDTVVWRGREDFADGRPRVAFARTGPVDGGGLDVDLPGGGDGSSLRETGPAVALGVGIVSVLGLIAAAVHRRRNGSRRDGDARDVPGDTATPAETSTEQEAAPDQETAPGRETTPGRKGASDPEAATDAERSSGDTTETPVLTDEERVQDLLETEGGRMRQAEIAEAFDWSASKTSRVVGRMAEEGAVEKLRLGRENLVALTDE